RIFPSCVYSVLFLSATPPTPIYTLSLHDALPISIQDAPRLSELGASTFRDTFEADNAADDIAAYIAEAFTPQRQEQEIADPASIVLLVEDEGVTGSRELIGYAHLVSGPAPECVPDLQPIE